MSAPKDPAVTPEPEVREEKTPEVLEQPDDKFLKAVHDLTEAVKASGTDAEKRLAAAKIMQDVEKAREKNRRVVVADTPGAYRSMKDILSRPARLDIDKDIQELNDKAFDRMEVRTWLAKKAALNGSPYSQPKWSEIPEYRELMDLHTKAAGSWWDTGSAAGGAEWVPTGYSARVIDYYTLPTTVASQFPQEMMPDGEGSRRVPSEITEATVYIATQTAAATANMFNTSLFSQAQTDYATLTAVKHEVDQGVSVEGTEDMVINTLERMRNGIRKAMAKAADGLCINAQRTPSDATLDDAPATSGLYYADAAGIGLRIHCIEQSTPYTTAVGGPLTGTTVLTGREAMGKYGVNTQEQRLFVSPVAYLGLLQDTNLITVDKMGAQATLVTGQMASIGGVPVVVTEGMPETLDAGGINAGTGSVTGAIIANVTRFIFGSKRTLEILTVPHPGYDSVVLIGRQRVAFAPSKDHTDASDHTAHYFINVS